MNTNRSILVVDDSIHNLSFIIETLRAEGYTVLDADNGNKALELCAKMRFDLFIIDVQMPVMSGLDLLRELAVFDNVYEAIMMTGAENLEDAKLAMELGAFSYIGKPVRIDELLTQVSRALRMVEVKKQHLERLAQAERMRDSILSVAAHELRTPINIIMNYVEVLQHQGENGEVRNEALIDMRRTGRRINRLVKRIISLQKRPRSL